MLLVRSSDCAAQPCLRGGSETRRALLKARTSSTDLSCPMRFPALAALAHASAVSGTSPRRTAIAAISAKMTQDFSVPRRGPGPRAQSAMTSIVGALLLVAASVLPVAADGPASYGDWGAPTAVTAANTAAH